MSDGPKPPDLEVSIPSPEGLRVAVEDFPYHFLHLADLAGSEDGSVSGSLADGVVSVNANNFAEFMQQSRPSTRFKLTDPVASGGVMAEIEVAFESLKDFDPKSLAMKIAPTQRLFAARDPIVKRMRGQLSTAALASAVVDLVTADTSLAWLADVLKWSPSQDEVESSAVDDLLGQLDLGDGSAEASDAPPSKSPVGKIVSAAAGGSAIPAEEASACRRALAELDKRIGSWITAVLHAPQVRSIETAWRSLHFLITHMEFRKGVRLSVLHAPFSTLLERVRSRLIDPVFDEGADAPDLIVVDHLFSQSAPDMEALDELAQHAASLPAVVLVGAGPAFLGVKHTFQIATLPTITNLFDQWQFAKFKTLRTETYARNLAVVFGRGLLREPSRRGELRDLEFGYGEPSVTEKDFLWAGGAVAAACTIANSVAETGWPTGVAGYVHGRLAGFKMAKGGKKGDKTFGPADCRLNAAKIEELGMAGLNAVVRLGDTDDVVVWNGMSVAAVPRNDAGAIFEISLPYQLFASRISTLMFALKKHLIGMPQDKLVAFVSAHVRSWLSAEDDADQEVVSVQVRQAENAPGVLELAATVTPPANLLPGGVPMVMGYRIS